MKRINGLPVYAATLAAGADGVLRVSLVEDPAVQSNFDVFKAVAKTARALYAVADEDRHLVRGVVLRADFPIYRKDTPEDPGYYVIFSAEQIRQMAEKYIADHRLNAVDLDHDGPEVEEGINMVQLFIKDTAAGVAPEGFDDIADGSLFAEYHVTNEDVWEEIKAGTYKGFSVEIFYTLVPMSRQDPERSPLDRLFDKIQDKMSFAKFKERLAALLAEPEPEKFGSVTTDKGVLHWDGDEDLKAGDRVEVEDADGNRTEAPDGDYVTSDGKTIVVTDGAVAEIRDPEAEVAPEEEPAEETAQMKAQRRAAKFEESYTEKSRKIAEAIVAARGNREDDYGYLADAGDDFAVWAYYSEETGWEDKFVRYAVTWDEEGNASVSNPIDVRRAFVPLDFDDSAAFNAAPAAEDEAAMEAALAAAERFQAENATLRARVAELEKQPAAAPAHDSFKGSGPDDGPAAGMTGSKGLDRLARIMGA